MTIPESDAQRRITWLIATLSGTAIVCTEEAVLQKHVARMLKTAGVKFVEQHPLTAHDRLDFFCQGIAVELKTQGSPADLLRQVDRYIAHADVQGVLVITTKASHTGLPSDVRGKPVGVVWMGAL